MTLKILYCYTDFHFAHIFIFFSPDNHLFQQECPDKKQDADEKIVEKRHTRLSILIDYVRYQIHGDEVFTVEPEVPN